MTTAVDYHKRPEWSYSSMKKILESGIDYAVAEKQGLIPGPRSAAIDLGQLTHMLILGGEDTFAICEFDDYRTKAAREWRDEQIANNKNIVTKTQWEAVKSIVEHIESHPHTKEYLTGDGFKHEVEMYAKAEGVDLRGKADALKITGDSMIITDIKTTAQFDKFFKSASWNHYDLQAAVYTLVGSASQKISATRTNYYFCVVETVVPYRVQFFHAGLEFIEAGERKLRKCIDAIKDFCDKTPNFLLADIPELGDFSL